MSNLRRREFLRWIGHGAMIATVAPLLTGVGRKAHGLGGTIPTASLTSFHDPADQAAAVREAVRLAGGIPWLKPGQRVLIKPALNSPKPFPYTASSIACAELVRLCLEAGASEVYVADEMGIEHSLGALEDIYGSFRGEAQDSTIGAFKQTGIWSAVQEAAGDLSQTGQKVRVTSFREHGWRPWKSDRRANGNYVSNLFSPWVRKQLSDGETWQGGPVLQPYIPREFDGLAWWNDEPGMYVPRLFDRVDHVINLFRISTHIFSHYTMAMKNWIGVMRPDERLWMHQLNYIKNNRHQLNGLPSNDPIRSEMPYHELLADLHLFSQDKKRLCVADASQVIVSGGPDGTDRQLYRSNLILAATDVVSADVVGLSILRRGIQENLGGRCSKQPQSVAELGGEWIGNRLFPKKHPGVFYGQDTKLCDLSFSNWDWVAIQRGRELGIGPQRPDALQLVFADAPRFALGEELRAFIADDALRPPRLKLQPLGTKFDAPGTDAQSGSSGGCGG